MATVIDALVMTLGLDTSDYDKGRRDVTEGLAQTKKQSDAVAKGMYEGGKKAASFFSSIKNELIGLLAVVAAGKGLNSFLTDSISGMATLGRSAAYLGMSAKQLDAWGMAAETVGGTTDGMKSSLQGLASGIEEFKLTGQSPMVGVFRAMGVAVTDAGGHVRSYGDLMTDLADKFKAMSGQDALAFGKRLGFDEGTVNLLREGGPAVKALVDQMSHLSGATQEGVASAERNQAEWAKIRAHFKGIRETISSELDPALEKIAEKVLKWLDANHQLIATKIIAFVEGFVDAVIKIVNWLTKADTATDGWSTKLIIAAGALRLLTGGGILGGLGRLATGLVGVSSAALAASVAVGALIGTGIYKLSEGTALGDFFQKTAALVAAAAGSKEAQDALYQEKLNSLPAHIRDTIIKARGSSSSPGDPGKARDASSSTEDTTVNSGSGAPDGAASPTKSKLYGSNAELFSALEQHGGLPPGILQRMFMQESGGGKHLQSAAGAKGPFQFMDATAAQMGLHGDDVNDLDKSATAAAGYLEGLRDIFGGDMTKAVAAYNAGPGNVRKYGGVPPFAETQNYVKSVMGGGRSGAGSTAPSRAQSGGGNTSTVETHIQKIEVVTQATDADGMARAAKGALQRNQLVVAQANTGMG